MFKKAIISLLFVHVSLFAQEQPERKHLCKAAKMAIQRFEFLYIASDRDSCLTDHDCTFLITVPWKLAEIWNKTTLAGYNLMLKDNSYKDLIQSMRLNCSERHPDIIVPQPETVHCISKICTPIFASTR